jgi:hypothetical protein
MGLFEYAREALAAGGKSDLRLEQALEVVRGYDEARANAPRVHGPVGDAANLPFPKDTIKWALLQLMGAIDDAAQREPLKAGFVGIAEWQDVADVESGGFDSSRLRRKIDPLSLAKEFAARATPGDRWLAASRDEKTLLVEELRRKGLW